MGIRELIEQYLEAEKIYKQACEAVIAEMKRNKWKTFVLAPKKWITFYSSNIQDRIAYYDRNDEEITIEGGHE